MRGNRRNGAAENRVRPAQKHKFPRVHSNGRSRRTVRQMPAPQKTDRLHRLYRRTACRHKRNPVAEKRLNAAVTTGKLFLAIRITASHQRHFYKLLFWKPDTGSALGIISGVTGITVMQDSVTALSIFFTNALQTSAGPAQSVDKFALTLKAGTGGELAIRGSAHKTDRHSARRSAPNCARNFASFGSIT